MRKSITIFPINSADKSGKESILTGGISNMKRVLPIAIIEHHDRLELFIPKKMRRSKVLRGLLSVIGKKRRDLESPSAYPKFFRITGVAVDKETPIGNYICNRN